MTHRSLSVTLDVVVHDEVAFREAARQMAVATGDEDPGRFLQEDDTTLGECAQMLFDPGESHPGSEIVQSSYDNHQHYPYPT